jgi:prepilin-type N-terminal cleavage/methylation domain-containing protein
MSPRSPDRSQSGMTMLEIVVVLIIIAGLAYLGAMAASRLTRSKLNDDTNEIAGLARRTSQLATETGYLHRLVLDLDAGTYRVEECKGGPAAIDKNPERKDNEQSEDQKRAAIEEARRKLQSVPQNVLPSGANQEDGEAMALALAGELSARRTCALAVAESGKFDNKELRGNLSGGVKIRSVWVQHLQDPVSSGMVALHFFPIGSAEKAIVELADDDDTFSVMVHGLTGRIELRDTAVSNPEDFFLRDVTGDEVPES